MDTIIIIAVAITPNTVETGEQIKIAVDALFFRPVGTLLFDRSPYDRGVWSPEPE